MKDLCCSRESRYDKVPLNTIMEDCLIAQVFCTVNVLIILSFLLSYL